jgi:hypothetical protein
MSVQQITAKEKTKRLLGANLFLSAKNSRPSELLLFRLIKSYSIGYEYAKTRFFTQFMY